MVKLIQHQNLTAEMVDTKIDFVVTGAGQSEIYDNEKKLKKPVIYVHGSYKDSNGEIQEINWNLNFTIRETLTNAGFPDTDDLEGCTLRIEKVKVPFQGKKVDGLRIESLTDTSGKVHKFNGKA